MIAFHFLILAVGEILKYKEAITETDLQKFINEDPAFGARPPLKDCRLALRLMDDCGLIMDAGFGEYVKDCKE